MKRHKLLIIGLLIIFIVASLSLVQASTYVGNSNSGKFHYESCRWAQKISPSHRVEFNTREEAINEGYVPCKVCKP